MPFSKTISYHRSMKLMIKTHELHFELFSSSPYSPDWNPSDFYLFAELNKWSQEQRFGSNREVIAEIQAYFAKKLLYVYKVLNLNLKMAALGNISWEMVLNICISMAILIYNVLKIEMTLAKIHQLRVWICWSDSFLTRSSIKLFIFVP